MGLIRAYPGRGEGEAEVGFLLTVLGDDPDRAAGRSRAGAGWQTDDGASSGRGHAALVEKVDVAGELLPRVFLRLPRQQREQVVHVDQPDHRALGRPTALSSRDD